MGSYITLRVGRLEVDWGKNNAFTDHSNLFRATDLAEADYFYADDVVERKPAYVRKLRHVIPRLELLGYSLKGCERAYEQNVRYIPDYYPEMTIGFDTFCRALRAVDLDRVVPLEEDGDFDLGEFGRNILRGPAFQGLFPEDLSCSDGAFFENLDTNVVLRLLGTNPANLDRDVVWGIEDVVEAGWVDGNILKPLDDGSRFLIVTEGSSDSTILKTALPIVAPDVDDFFEFIDMKDNYPFTGTGNLVNFCKGLAAIRAQNRMVIVFDNDTAGKAAMRRLQPVRMPPNMRLIRLPDLEAFRDFPTLGPSGRSREDVNGRAVAIESFLDLDYGPTEEMAVRWTGFDHEVGEYQGELVKKEIYARRFHEHFRDDGYELSKLHFLWSHILQACSAEAVA